MSTHMFEIDRTTAESLVDLIEGGTPYRPDLLIIFTKELRERFGMAPIDKGDEYNIYMRLTHQDGL